MHPLPEKVILSSISNTYGVHTPPNGALTFRPRIVHGLVLYKNGFCDYHYENYSFTAHPGSLLFLPQGQPYSIKPQGESDCLCINFSCEEMMGIPAFSIDPTNAGSIQALFEKAISTWKRYESGYISSCMSCLYAIIAELQRQLDEMQTGYHGMGQLKKAYIYIHSHYKDPDLRVSFLASECHMSERSFRSKFETVFGVTPTKYINNLRMTYARDLLSSHMVSVSEAALNSGYRDIYYFSRVFKQHYGISPSYYVRST